MVTGRLTRNIAHSLLSNIYYVPSVSKSPLYIVWKYLLQPLGFVVAITDGDDDDNSAVWYE